ncbi:IS3 family transposase [Corynebacterium sp. zg254]|uniref:IS3 family transposase n=1 Tax=Corynebacterium TaxID=1716 RepID=UPI0035B55A72
MARLLGVSRSGYHKWACRNTDKRASRDRRQRFYDDLDQQVHSIWKDSDEVYGSSRITAELRDRGVKVYRKTVPKRMRLLGIVGMSPRTFTPVATIQSPCCWLGDG